MDWFIIDKDYVQYLKNFDVRVGDVDYGKRLKLYIGILLKVNNVNYYVPVSSPKPKHDKMSNQVDFYKIVDFNTGKLYAVINLNNMIPVPDSCVTKLLYNKIEEYREFKSDREKQNYVFLLQKEKAIIDALENNGILSKMASKLYDKCQRNPNSKLASRCCDFKMLEEKALDWKL